MSTHRDARLLTDRDERALLAAVEQRISAPLRPAAAQRRLARGRSSLWRFAPGRPRGSAQGRESLSWQQTPRTPSGPAPTGR
ncbi:hypothetical protein GCM10010347_50860 [Streptomyces cirratus]|uniref:Transposase n=1 Tax=Streptomyces cirratus TaxID=68187 RepID=A0ABQ3EYM2_9ACTN|nr:hypothetical protein [Streptomyces cirratus]GHB74320.1 hypothetical protein GCM10010347_50860 [Streptomyces cirratus]